MTITAASPSPPPKSYRLTFYQLNKLSWRLYWKGCERFDMLRVRCYYYIAEILLGTGDQCGVLKVRTCAGRGFGQISFRHRQTSRSPSLAASKIRAALMKPSLELSRRSIMMLVSRNTLILTADRPGVRLKLFLLWCNAAGCRREKGSLQTR